MIHFDLSELSAINPRISIKVIGVGGAGGNMINSMVDAQYTEGIEFIAVNTDSQALKNSKAHYKVQLGVKATRGLGSGANPDVGRRAAEEDMEKVLNTVQDAQVIFLAGGMGGGTGSGALPTIAQALKDKNILLISVVTTPFNFEGRRRMAIAQAAIEALEKQADTLIVIPNQRLLEIAEREKEHNKAPLTMMQAFNKVNDVLGQSVKSIADIIEKPGHINVDFADVRTIMKDKGLAVMGTGRASGENRARQATLNAIASPLLGNMSIEGASGVLLNVTGPSNMGIDEVCIAAEMIHGQVKSEDANIIFGSVIDDTLKDEMVVTVVATGFVQGQGREKEAEFQVKPTLLDRSSVSAPTVAPVRPEEDKPAPVVTQTQEPAYTNWEEEKLVQELDVPAYLRNKKDKQKRVSSN